MAGRQTLDLSIEVRILVPQPALFLLFSNELHKTS